MTGNELAVRQENLQVQKESYGTVAFTNEVIATLAGLAAANVAGVAEMSGTFADGLTEFLGRKKLTKGIQVDLGKEEIAVKVTIIAEYGKSIPQIARSVQEQVKQAIEAMAGIHVTGVDVHVQGIQVEAVKADVKEPELTYA